MYIHISQRKCTNLRQKMPYKKSINEKLNKRLIVIDR